MTGTTDNGIRKDAANNTTEYVTKVTNPAEEGNPASAALQNNGNAQGTESEQATVNRDLDARIRKEVRKQTRWLSIRTKVAVVVAALIGAFGAQLVNTYVFPTPAEEVAATSKPAKVTGVHAWDKFGGTGDYHSVKATWSDNDKAASYQVRVTYKKTTTKKVKKGKKVTKKKVTKNVTRTYNAKKNSISGIKVPLGKASTVQVRAKNAAGYGAWSAKTKARYDMIWEDTSHYENVTKTVTKKEPYKVTVVDRKEKRVYVKRYGERCNYCGYIDYEDPGQQPIGEHVLWHMRYDQEYRDYIDSLEPGQLVTNGATWSFVDNSYYKTIPAVTHKETKYRTVKEKKIVGKKWISSGEWFDPEFAY